MPGDSKQFLDHAYSVETPEDTKALYDDWAETYETEIKANGYATPARCAAALAAAVADRNAPLLDLGCGTGLSGAAFKDAGFTTIDGTDFSKQMLAYAQTKTGVYRNLILGDVNNPLPGTAGDYDSIAAVGVFSPSHALPNTIDDVVDRLPMGGCFVFSLNDHTLETPAYEQHIEALAGTGRVEIAFREYGDHLPGRGINALVYVLRRC